MNNKKVWLTVILAGLLAIAAAALLFFRMPDKKEIIPAEEQQNVVETQEISTEKILPEGKPEQPPKNSCGKKSFTEKSTNIKTNWNKSKACRSHSGNHKRNTCHRNQIWRTEKRWTGNYCTRRIQIKKLFQICLYTKQILIMKYQGYAFKNRKVDFYKLENFGFENKHGYYTYKTELQKGKFELCLTISEAGELDYKIIETSTDEEYEPAYIKNAEGKFVGEIRQEAEDVISLIAARCTEFTPFSSDYTYKVIDYIKEKYSDEPEYLWEKFPDNAIFRNKKNQKWYAAILTVQKSKVGLQEDGTCEVIDLKGKPEKITSIVDGIKFLPGYHMNKKHWYTIRLDGSVNLDEIFKHIDSSYNAVN